MEENGQTSFHEMRGFEREAQSADLYQLDINREEMQRVLGLRERFLRFLLWAFGVSLAFTFMIVLLEGWHVKGFDIPDALLYTFVGSTVGELAGAFILAITGGR